MHTEERTSKVLVLTEENVLRLLAVIHDAVTIMSGKNKSLDAMVTQCNLLGFANSIEDEMGF